MSDMQTRHGGLSIDLPLATFLEEHALPGSGIDPARFWSGFAAILDRFAPENRALLAERDRMQAALDDWHGAHAGAPIDQAAYQRFLRDIGYLVDAPERFTIDPHGVDAEVARIAGPQLVVPILNARFLLNAANARWGSLYDALYGSDAIAPVPTGGGYDPARGGQVIAWARA